MAQTLQHNRWMTSMLHTIVLFLKGTVIGVGAILPGISGGVLCVVFGIYEPLMEMLANPFQNFKKHYKMVIPVGIGAAVGFIGLAGLVNFVMEKSGSIAVCVFAGLILGMLPGLWKEAKGKAPKRGKGPVLAMCISFSVLLAFLLLLQYGNRLRVVPSIPWYLFCGVAWGLSVVVPGMSSSSMLIFLGLFQPMLEGISKLVPSVIVPVGIGAAAVVLLLPRLINFLLKKYRSYMFHAIFGIVLATTVPIIPLDYGDTAAAVVGAVCVFGGFLAAYFMDKGFRRIEQRADEK